MGMQTLTYRIEVPKSARYVVSAGFSSSVKYLWFVLHGYSQLAAEFITGFDVLAGSQTLLVAPEGLSRFYVKGYFGKVGASWMTKEQRTDDISDNIRYLDLLYEDVINRIQHTPEKVIVLGYSQGGATAVRWSAITEKKIDHLIIHSSEFPKDVDESLIRQFCAKARLWYVYSNSDEFIDLELFEQQFDYLRQNDIPFTPVMFEGRHEIRKEVIAALNRRILQTD